MLNEKYTDIKIKIQKENTGCNDKKGIRKNIKQKRGEGGCKHRFKQGLKGLHTHPA